MTSAVLTDDSGLFGTFSRLIPPRTVPRMGHTQAEAEEVRTAVRDGPVAEHVAVADRIVDCHRTLIITTGTATLP